MKNILIPYPSYRDQIILSENDFKEKYNLIFYNDNNQNEHEKFDAVEFIEHALKKFKNEEIDGVISTDDYPGCIISSVLANKLNLPSPEPEKILLCQHKYYCRQAQLSVVPIAVPAFMLIDPSDFRKENLSLKFPFFVKPVKSFFSIMAGVIYNIRQLEDYFYLVKKNMYDFVKPFNQLLKKYTSFQINGNNILAEELLEGNQITIEGFSYNGKAEIIAITDSIMFPGTISFQRFEYPSKISKEVQQRMERIAIKFINRIGFDNGIFNIEMFYNTKKDQIRIIEVNPRMASQFADLMEKVHGTNTYEIQIELALGKKPKFEKDNGKFKNAASFVLRTFEDKKIIKIPKEKEIELVKNRFPDTRIEIFGEEGKRLSEEVQDGRSYRYGLINIGAKNEEELFWKKEEIKKMLKFEFVKI